MNKRDKNTDGMTAPKASTDEVQKAIGVVLDNFTPPSRSEFDLEIREAIQILKEVRDNQNWVIYVP